MARVKFGKLIARRRFISAVIGLFFIVVMIILWRSFSISSKEETERVYQYIPVECWFKADYQRDISCAQFVVPANGGEFRLPVVIIKDDSPLRREEPMMYLNGGPGVSLGLDTDGIARWLSWMRVANIGRDLILMDPRGVGRSTPLLFCEAMNKFNVSLLDKNLPIKHERESNLEVFSSCITDLEKKHPVIKSKNFGTQQSAKDALELLKILQNRYPEYKTIHLLGVSYGTRLALEMIRQAQNSGVEALLGSVVLDSVYPAGKGGVESIPQVVGNSFEHFFYQCFSDPACMLPFSAEIKPSHVFELKRLYFSVLEKLASNPKKMMVRVNDDLPPHYFLINDSRFLAATFSSAYNVSSWTLITAAMQDVLNNTQQDLKVFIEAFLANSESPYFNELAFLFVDCADNGTGSENEFINSLNRYSDFKIYFEHEWAFQVCHTLPDVPTLTMGKPPAVPVLVIAGVDDPVTPVAWARELKELWLDIQLIEREGVAHAVLGNDVCMLEQLAHFYDKGEPPRNCE